MSERTAKNGVELARAVSEIESGGLVRLGAGVFELPYRLLVKKDLRIVGAGSGQTEITCSTGILAFDGPSTLNQLSISGVTLSGAASDMDGPALRVQSAMVVLNDVVFLDNRVPDGPFAGGGAAAFIRCSHVHLNECVFLSNRAPYGGALLASHCGEVRLSNCHFQGNSANKAGDILAAESTAVRIIQCTFGKSVDVTPRLVVESAPHDACELAVVGTLFTGRTRPIEVPRSGTTSVELSHNAFDPSAKEAIAQLDMSESQKRDLIKANSDDAIVIDGLTESEYCLRLVKPNRFRDNSFVAISLKPVLEGAFRALPEPIEQLRGRVLPTSVALPTVDILGKTRSQPTTIGCVEAE